MFVDAAVMYVVLLISLVVHEAAHALTAMWGGDKTAYEGGQVTLNPAPHIQREPFGTVLLPIGLLIMSNGMATMGYAHAPIDPYWAERNPRKAALMSAAGPISNFLLVVLAAIVLKVLVLSGVAEVARIHSFDPRDLFVPVDSGDNATRAICRIASVFVFLNLLLGILNLIPWPPLDGAGVVGGFFPRSAGRFYENLRRQPLLPLVGMIAIFYLVFEHGHTVLTYPINWVAYFVKGFG